jgi:DnaJ domain
MSTNYYDILGLTRNASLEEIRSSYKRLAKTWHPDLNSHRIDTATENFKKISVAYRILSSSDLRSQYDTELNAEASGNNRNYSTLDFTTFAQSLFNNGLRGDLLVGALLGNGCSHVEALKIIDSLELHCEKKKPEDSTKKKSPVAASPRGDFHGEKKIYLGLGLFLCVIVFVVNRYSIEESTVETAKVPMMGLEKASEKLVGSQIPTVQVINEAEALKAALPMFSSAAENGEVLIDIKDEVEMSVFRSSKGLPLPAKIETRLEIKGVSTQVLYFISIWPNKNVTRDYDCHSCRVALSLVVLEKHAHEWKIKMPLHQIGFTGAWGKTALEKDFVPYFLYVGKNRPGFVIKQSGMWQGWVVEWADIYGQIENKYVQLGDVKVSEARKGGVGLPRPICEEEHRSDCAYRQATFVFDRNSQRSFYPIIVSQKGQKFDYKENVLKALRPNYSLSFNGKSLECVGDLVCRD